MAKLYDEILAVWLNHLKSLLLKKNTTSQNTYLFMNICDIITTVRSSRLEAFHRKIPVPETLSTSKNTFFYRTSRVAAFALWLELPCLTTLLNVFNFRSLYNYALWFGTMIFFGSMQTSEAATKSVMWNKLFLKISQISDLGRKLY